MRYLGLDYGAYTVGCAVCLEEGLVPIGIETIRRKHEDKLRRTLARIEALIAKYDLQAIVLGLPLNMDGSEGERAAKTREFMAHLERRTGLPVYLQDERLTSWEAENALRGIGYNGKTMKKEVDRVAAQIILQDYLNGQNHA